jgi:hypothetical protein
VGAADDSGRPSLLHGAVVATFAAPRVRVVVKTQSVAASFVSVPSGIRLREPAAVFESATVAGSIVPSTRL